MNTYFKKQIHLCFVTQDLMNLCCRFSHKFVSSSVQHIPVPCVGFESTQIMCMLPFSLTGYKTPIIFLYNYVPYIYQTSLQGYKMVTSLWSQVNGGLVSSVGCSVVLITRL